MLKQVRGSINEYDKIHSFNDGPFYFGGGGGEISRGTLRYYIIYKSKISACWSSTSLLGHCEEWGAFHERTHAVFVH